MHEHLYLSCPIECCNYPPSKYKFVQNVAVGHRWFWPNVELSKGEDEHMDVNKGHHVSFVVVETGEEATDNES